MLSNNKIIIAVSSVFVIILIAASIFSIYRGGVLVIPGMAPTVFKKGDEVVVNVCESVIIAGTDCN